jgi:putative heme-binding domain-containing protein
MDKRPWSWLMTRNRLLIGCALTAAVFGVRTPLHAQGQTPPAVDALHAQPSAADRPRSPEASADGAANARGKAIFEGKGACQTCHRVNGVGSRVAPDLTSIGSTLAADAVTKTLTDPNAALRPAVRSVRATTKDGKVVVGLRLNEDRYSVQLIDEQERLRSLTKSDLRDYSILTTARMPSYREKLTPPEIADVVAYLRSLKNP